MTVSAKVYPNGQKHIANGDTDLDGDAINCALVANTYTPADTDEYFDTHVAGDEASGTGYTGGGQALTGKSVSVTMANSWSATWAATTAYAVGQVIRPTTGNGHLYKCITAGTTGSSEPTWPTTALGTVDDGTATWIEIGVAAIIWNSSNPSWASSTITSRYAVFFVDGAAGSSDYLISYIDFGQDESSSSSEFTVVIDDTGIVRQFVASAA